MAKSMHALAHWLELHGLGEEKTLGDVASVLPGAGLGRYSLAVPDAVLVPTTHLAVPDADNTRLTSG